MREEMRQTIERRGEDSDKKKKQKGNRMAIVRRPGWGSLVFTR
jgi:hypothetical protein